jgi:hypothetical protein
VASAADTPAGEALLRIRRERVHTAMLIELLVLLVFLALAFAFVKDSEKRFDTLQEQLLAREREVAAARRQIRVLEVRNRILQGENEALGQSLRRFIRTHEGPLRANDRIVAVRAATFDAQVARITEAERIVEERQKENATLRATLAASGKGGSDLPPCTVASGRFIARIDLLPSGAIRVRPKWDPAAAAQVARVPGLAELASSREIDGAAFRRLARQVQAWGKNQPTPCGFYVEVYSQHARLDLYKRQFQLVGAHFYPAMR